MIKDFALKEAVLCPCCNKPLKLEVSGDIKTMIQLFEVSIPGEEPRLREVEVRYLDKVHIDIQ